MKKSQTNYLTAQSVDEVLEQLKEIISQSLLDEDYICLFTYVYRETTVEIKNAIESHRFEDPAGMEKMDVIFANLFIDAYRGYRNCKPVSKAWQIAFEAGKERLAFVQHILLGMNAHINMDLAIAAAEVSEGKEIIDLKHDFMIVNQILAELTNKMQADLGQISFGMKLLDIFGFRSDEKIINFSIKKARDFAWLNAMELSLLPKSKRPARQNEIDKRVALISKIVKDPPSGMLSFLLKIISIFESKPSGTLLEKLGKTQAESSDISA